MGGTSWSARDYEDRRSVLRSKGMSDFAYHDDVASGKVAAKVHDKMNPHGVKMRESRDSDAHPESLGIAVLFDVTGSMGGVPRILQQKLPKLMGLVMQKAGIEHPAIMVGAIGDVTCDRAALQVGQFESGIEIDEDLGKLWLEGGGGGQIMESYELGAYFMSRHTALDCFEKRGKKGYLFIIGDEKARDVSVAAVQKVFGETLEADIPLEKMFQEVQEKYHTFYINPKMTSYYGQSWLKEHWTRLVGEHFLQLEEPEAVCELIASTIAMMEGALDEDGVAAALKDAGTSDHAITAVTRAMSTVKKGAGAGALKTSVPKSGAASGLATV